jgi:hypothetical protein
MKFDVVLNGLWDGKKYYRVGWFTQDKVFLSMPFPGKPMLTVDGRLLGTGPAVVLPWADVMADDWRELV